MEDGTMVDNTPLSDVEHREIRDEQITRIMLLVDKLVDFETNLATLRSKGELLQSYESQQHTNIVVTTRRIWDGMEKLYDNKGL